jgi:hypothetical protein
VEEGEVDAGRDPATRFIQSDEVDAGRDPATREGGDLQIPFCRGGGQRKLNCIIYKGTPEYRKKRLACSLLMPNSD